jgi:HEAT repeat protein
VRSLSARALGEIGDRSVIHILKKTLTDPNKWVRNNAALSLYKLRDNSGIPVLIENLSSPVEDKKYSVRQEANNFLKQLSGKDFGFDPRGKDADREEAIARWKEWWRAGKAAVK